MDEHMHLHDNERLLVNLRASTPTLVVGLFRAVIDALIFAAVVSVVVLIVGWAAFEAVPGWYGYIAIFLLCYAFAAFMRWRFWRESTFRVTTERILFHHRTSYLYEPMHTIKWPQFQESVVQRRGPLELFFGVRGLCVRYGTADAEHMACFPALPYAADLKHYLDKVDSAVRGGNIDEVKAFVQMPKGLRDKF